MLMSLKTQPDVLFAKKEEEGEGEEEEEERNPSPTTQLTSGVKLNSGLGFHLSHFVLVFLFLIPFPHRVRSGVTKRI